MTPIDPDDLATGLIRVDARGRVDWLNAAAADLLGPSVGAIRGRPLQAFSTTLGDWLGRVTSAGRPLRAPEACLEVTGISVDASFRPLEDSVLIELHPVAERVRHREMADRADRQQSVSLLSRRLAHELRNPLAGVRGAAQLIASRTQDSSARKHADMIQREVDRITRLIEHFAGGGAQQPATINLHQVLDEACELVSAEQQGGLDMAKDFDPSIPELRADGGQLHQLFLNLLRNSAQAGAHRILLVTRIEHRSPLIDDPERHAVRIDVIDDGSGVPEDLRERLFLPLVSGRDQGSGFGLAIVQQIARSHGGLVEYQPLDGGSCFRLRLPLIPADESADE